VTWDEIATLPVCQGNRWAHGHFSWIRCGPRSKQSIVQTSCLVFRKTMWKSRELQLREAASRGKHITHMQRLIREASKQLTKAPEKNYCSISARLKMRRSILWDCQVGQNIWDFCSFLPQTPTLTSVKAREKRGVKSQILSLIERQVPCICFKNQHGHLL
jgi:hypothetical protein